MVDIELKFFYLFSAKQKPTVPGGGYVQLAMPATAGRRTGRRLDSLRIQFR